MSNADKNKSVTESRPVALVFDVNGTLLNTHALAPKFRKIFGNRYSVREWYLETIGYAMAVTIAATYRDFGDLAIATLCMAAESRGIKVQDQDVERFRQAMRHLPPFPDVRSGLKRLKNAGFRLAALSNSGTGALTENLQHAGFDDCFEQILSVETVGRFKPASETYLHAAKSLGIAADDMMMVAAHHWDLMGAAYAGCRTAFLARNGESVFPGAAAPEYVASTVTDLADQMAGPARSKSLVAGLLAGTAATALLAVNWNRLRYGG